MTKSTRRCRICGKRQSVANFYLSRGKPRAECKKCTLERLKEWQHAHPDKRRTQNQRYYARHYSPHPRPRRSIEEQREQRREYMRRYRQAHLAKNQARPCPSRLERRGRGAESRPESVASPN